jgi:hypothetical protein
MKYANRKDLLELSQDPENSLAISIFIPTHKISTPENFLSDRIRMKNAIQDIQSKLQDRGVRENELSMYLDELMWLYNDNRFWKERDNALAIYVKKDKIITYDLPIEIEPLSFVSDSFIISPLVAANHDDFNYYVLDLNLKNPRFFSGSQNHIKQLLVDEMPKDIETALRIDENQVQLQHGTSRGGTRDAHHHGQGAAKDNSDKDVKKYLRLIDKILWENYLNISTEPLIVAGDVSHANEFIDISRYKNIEDDIATINQEKNSIDELHEKTWHIMKNKIKHEEKLFFSSFEIAKHSDKKRALEKPNQILRAAKEGRVMTLALSLITRTYDSVVSRLEQQFKITLPSDAKLLNNIEKTTRDVLRNGGNVKSMLYKHMNDDNTIKAIAR